MLSLPSTLGLVEAPLWVDRLGAELRDQEASELVIDASALSEFDSSVLAVLLQVRREAARLNRSVVVQGSPAKLIALATLYGVNELLALTP